MTSVSATSGLRTRSGTMFLVGLIMIVGLLGLPKSASAVDVGTLGPSTSGASAPTGQKPESKLWWHEGHWWGVLFDSTTARFTIWRFNWATDTWTNTGIVVDSRRQTSADALSSGSTLFIASHVKEGSSNADMAAKVMRFTYVPATDTYQLDTGFPLTLTSGAIETMVIDQDTLGRVWATWTTSNGAGGRQVMVTRSDPGGTGFITPFVLPMPEASNLTSDDISTLAGFTLMDGVGKIGLLWSNQATWSVNFATHVDTDPDGAWTFSRAMEGNELADDHLNLKGLRGNANGNVFVAAKTSLNASSDPLLVLLKMENTGTWVQRTISTVQYNQTRPIVVIDSENQDLHTFAATPCCSGGIVHIKSTRTDNPTFPIGVGTPFMEQSTSTTINNSTSTKQTVNSTTNLLVIAGDDNSRRYVFNKIDIAPPGGGGDTTPPETTVTSGPTGTVTATSATFEFTSSEAGSTFSCRLDGGAPTPCTSGITYNGLAVGGHTFTVAATDQTGNVDPSPASRSWTVSTGGGGAGIVRQATSVHVASSASNTATVTTPAGTSANDVLVACITMNGGTIPTTPSGWTRFAAVTSVSNPRVYGFYRVAGASESASYSWSLSSSVAHSVGVARYSGVDPTSPLDIATSAAGAAATSGTVPSMTTTSPNTMLAGCMGINTASTGVAITGPANMTQVWDLAGKRQEYDDAPQVPAGATGSRTWLFSASRAWAGWQIALRPDTSGPDTTPPDTTITSGPSGTVSSTSATFLFTATEAGSTFACTLDGGTSTPCTSGVTYANLAEGPHTFTVTATDAANNTDPTPATRTWTVETIDVTPPDTTITSGPSGTVDVTAATFGFTSTEAGSTFACTVDGGAPAPCTSGVTFTGLADGPHTFTVAATDPANNTDPTPATRTWTVDTTDTTPPDTTITSGPTGTVAATTATFDFTATEAGSTFACTIDGGAPAPCTSGLNYTDLTEGPHTFTVTATDAANNTDPTPATRTWTVETIDVTPPDTTITSGPTGTVSATTATFAFTATEAGSTFACTLDGGAPTPCTTGVTLTGLADRAHTFTVTATDAANNTDPTPATRTWTVDTTDTTPPDTTITSGPTGTVNTATATFDFTATEAGSTFACTLDGGAPTPCTTGVAYTDLTDGPHTFTVAATDAANNTDPTPATRTWTVSTATSAGIVRQSTSTTVATTASNVATATAPAGTSANDVLVACVTLNGTTVSAAPAGWTQFAASTGVTNPRVFGYYRVAGAAEPASYSWNLTSSVAHSVGIARYSGVSPTAPIDASASAAGASASSGAIPAITTTTSNALITGCMGINSGSTTIDIAPPSGMGEVWDIGGKRQEYADAIQAAAGSTGAKTWTFTSSREWAGWVLALRPS